MRYGKSDYAVYRNSNRTNTKITVYKYTDRHKDWNPIVMGTEILSVSISKSNKVITGVPTAVKQDMINKINECIEYIKSLDFTSNQFDFRKTATYEYAIIKDVPNVIFRIYLGQYKSGLEFFTDTDDAYIRESEESSGKAFDLAKLRLISKFKQLKSNLNDMI